MPDGHVVEFGICREEVFDVVVGVFSDTGALLGVYDLIVREFPSIVCIGNLIVAFDLPIVESYDLVRFVGRCGV